MTINRGALALLFIGLRSIVLADVPSQLPDPNAIGPTIPSNPTPYVQVDWPTAPQQTFTNATFSASPNVAVAPSTLFKQSVNMKLLVLSADGNEPSFAAIKYFLDHIAIPYDAVVLNAAGLKLPNLTDPSLNRGLYQGIVLSTGNLGYAGAGGWGSALTTADWTKLDDYQRNYGVRVAAFNSWPEARYGLALSGATGYSTSPTAPGKLALTAAGSSLFSYLTASNQLDVVYSFYYPSTAVAAAGETTTPIMTISGPGGSNKVVGVTHIAADGRESLTMTFDSNPYLMHAMALSYGVFNWVSKGVFIGQRKVYLTPQSDDFFLDNDQFVNFPAACKPSSFNLDPTYDPGVTCPTDRTDSGDLTALVTWQRNWQSKAQFKGFRLSHAFNGFGSTTDGGAAANDPLKLQAIAYKNDFFWMNHTWDHENLDCFDPVPNSGSCTPATKAESLDELQQNIALAKSMGIPNDTASMVTPNISGLNNPAFLQAAQESGIKYMVSDMSKPDWQPVRPNTGVRSPIVNSILFIPRRATSIFYNTKSGAVGAEGSLVDEYNYFYGPNGLFRISGTTTAFFNTNQTYAQIIDSESNTLLTYMMRGEWYPTMYHQSNLIRYSGQKSLYSDLMDATLTKFSKISNLPVSSLAQSTLGQMMEERMALNAGGVSAVYVPFQGITINSNSPVKVPLTGVCTTGCNSYGGQNLSTVLVAPATPAVIPLY